MQADENRHKLLTELKLKLMTRAGNVSTTKGATQIIARHNTNLIPKDDGLMQKLVECNDDVQRVVDLIATELNFDNKLAGACAIDKWLKNACPQSIPYIVDNIKDWHDFSLYDLDSMFAVAVARFKSNVRVLNREQRKSFFRSRLTWGCMKCSFSGLFEAVWTHSCSVHGTRSKDVFEVFASSSSACKFDMEPLAARKTMAAIRIQRLYRKHMYAPNHPWSKRHIDESTAKWGFKCPS